jgi:hypothetical protein
VKRIVVVALALWAASARAQEPEGAAADPTAPAHAPVDVSTPPAVLVLPPVSWPRALPVPDDQAIEALLLVGKDGFAQLEQCDLLPPLCDALRAALFEARFEPARIAGTPRAARVMVRFSVRADTTTATHADSAASAGADTEASAGGSTDAPEDEPAFGAVGRVGSVRPTAVSLELEQMREVPGSFGDPFRVIDALPGVLPVMTGLPYVYVRGAPPAATVYFFDDVQLPALFHLGLGPAVVHPAMVGDIDFYPGVAPARYGRKTGGVIAGQAAYRPLRKGVHGEVELRLVDAQAYLAKPLADGGRIEIGGRYGYPGLLLMLLEPRAVLQYWDYQLRSSMRVGERTQVSLLALGSYDLIGERTDDGFQRGIELQFHRIEARSVTRRGNFDIGYAIGGGFERSGFEDDFQVEAVRMTPRLWLDTKAGKAQLRVGADMLATAGTLSNPSDDEEDEDELEGLADNPIYRSATGRSVIGAYVEALYPIDARLTLEGGLRGDAWITGGDVQLAAEPRMLLRHATTDALSLHAAAGLAYQPAVFLIPLPAIADVALDRGLQRAVQTELGAALELPQSFSIDTKLFAHFYRDLLSFDAFEADDVECDPSRDDCDAEDGDDFPRMRAQVIGSEWMIRRAYRERLSGWLSYTLSKAWGQTERGRDLLPSFDVRHVANLVLQWRISEGWHVALRGYAQSARFPFDASTTSDPRQRRRLPPFFRGDLQLSRLWARSWGELRFTLDWLNFTFQREPTGWDCPYDYDFENGELSGTPRGECQVEYLEFPITLPMLGVRGSF